MKFNLVSKLFFGSGLILIPSFCLSSCAGEPVNNPEYVAINYSGKNSIICQVNQSGSINNWTLDATVYPLAASQKVEWSIQEDQTPNKVVKIKDNKIIWGEISTVGTYLFDLKATSSISSNAIGILTFYLNVTDSSTPTPEGISIDYNKNTTIYWDKDQSGSLNWSLSATVYPKTYFSQEVNFTVESISQEISNKIHITNNKSLSWDAIGSYGKYDFKLIATSANYLSVSTFLTFTINTIDDGKLSSEDYYDYIAERTLSIGAIGMTSTASGGYELRGVSSGTMWFYKRLDQYKYEFITNYHVWEGILSIANDTNYSATMLAVIGNPESYNPYTSNYGDYVQASKTSIKDMLSTLNPITVKVGTYTESSTTKDLYMDMCAFTLDLTTTYSAINTTINGSNKGVSQLKSEINNINNHYGIGEKIVNINTDKLSLNENVYIAGYPWANSEQTTESRGFTYLTEVKTKTVELKGPSLNILSNASYYTYQDQCFMEPKEVFALGGGASGSMVINEDLEVSGIYWGGMSKVSSAVYLFYPSAAFFNLDSSSSSAYGTHHFFEIVDQTISNN